MLIVAIAALFGACGSGSSSRGSLDPSPETEAALPEKAATPAQLLELKAKKYAQGLVPDGPPIPGALREAERHDQLVVLRAGYCYRVLGAGGDGVEDLDLFLYDPNGVQTQQDPGQDRFAVLGLQSEICPSSSGAYRLQALMYKGTGSYAVRVFRTP